MTIVVALFAFTFTIRTALPQAPVITYLEYQILISLIVLFIQCIGAVIEYQTEENVSRVVNYVCGALGGAIVFISVFVFIVRYILYKVETLEYDKEWDEYKKQIIAQKMQPIGITDVEFSACIGRGLKHNLSHSSSKSKEILPSK